MPQSSAKNLIFIFIGDIILLYLGLGVALGIRYNFTLNSTVVGNHFVPFTILFILWLVVFLIAGLYEKHVRVLKNRLPGKILRVQLINSIIAVIFFYTLPGLGIAPKTTLFIYLLISFVFITLWRMYGPLLLGNKAEGAIFIGSGAEFHELVGELKNNKGYPIVPRAIIDLDVVGNDISRIIGTEIKSRNDIDVVVADLGDVRIEPVLMNLYGLVAGGYSYVELHALYEDVFERLPVSLLDERWLIRNVSLMPRSVYDALKRAIDIVIGGILFIISLPFYAVAYILIKIDDKGPIFFVHERVGQHGAPIKIVKFRSMPVHHEADGLSKERKITKVGAFLRKSRIDELPQLWNVVRGDLSLIGPRPELPTLVKVYDEQVPYYSLRHVVKPGLSGWAQIKQKTPPKFMAEVDATKQKVAYDLYYIKHRSLPLDILISLQTIRELLSRRGI